MSCSRVWKLLVTGLRARCRSVCACTCVYVYCGMGAELQQGPWINRLGFKQTLPAHPSLSSSCQCVETPLHAPVTPMLLGSPQLGESLGRADCVGAGVTARPDTHSALTHSSTLIHSSAWEPKRYTLGSIIKFFQHTKLIWFFLFWCWFC